MVDVFAPNGEYKGQLSEYKEGPGAEGALKKLSSPCGVGVDGAGDAYVSDFQSGGVHKYHPSGNPVVNGDSVANFSSERCALAAGAGATAGFVFVDSFVGFGGQLFKLDASTGAVQYGGNPIAEGVSTVTLDPATGHVYAAKGAEVLEYDASGEAGATLVSTISVPSPVTGIAVDETSGHVFVAREGSHQIEAFGPLVTVTPPHAVTGSASEVERISATLNATVDPAKDFELTECFFRIRQNRKLRPDGPCQTARRQPDLGSGGSPHRQQPPHTVSADISGLEPNTAYHFLHRCRQRPGRRRR